MNRKAIVSCAAILLLIALCPFGAMAQDKVSVNAGADLVSRYVWRGLEFGESPSIQPSLSVDYVGFELGVWGAYTFSNNNTDSDEIDFWLSYSHEVENSVTVTAIVTDYYFPNAGIRMFNFNNHDHPDGAGAHTVEIGLSVAGPETFPLALTGSVNVHNDAGNNTYFELGYSLTAEDVNLDFFLGAAGGSKENPDYYGTDDLEVINLGVQASKDIKVTEDFSLPLFVNFSINPESEISYLVFGLSF